MKKLLLFVAIIMPSLAFAQGVRFNDIAMRPNGFPIQNASVAVCQVGANTTFYPCQPLATTYSGQSLTIAYNQAGSNCSNPTTSGNYGNYGFWAAPGHYIVQIFGPGLVTQAYDVFLPCDVTLAHGQPGACAGNISLPLSIANGGTGTATPALVAGTGISITGIWPNETVSTTAAGANLTLSNLTNPTSVNVPSLDFSGAAGLTALGSNNPVTLTPSGTANVIIGLNGLQFPDATVQTTAAVAGSSVVASVNLTSQTAAIGTTTLYTPSAQGMYLLTLVPYVNSPTGTSTISVTVVSVLHGFSISVPNATTTNATTSQNFRFSSWGFYPDASTAIQYSVSWTSGGAGDSYDLHMALVHLQ